MNRGLEEPAESEFVAALITAGEKLGHFEPNSDSQWTRGFEVGSIPVLETPSHRVFPNAIQESAGELDLSESFVSLQPVLVPAVHPYSHSIVAGGLLEMSSTTRLIPRTSLMMRFEIVCSVSCERWPQSAVMPSSLSTMRMAQASS